VIRALLLLVVLAAPAAAQRPQCGFGLGLQALREADRALRAGSVAPDLPAGRAAAEAAVAALKVSLGQFHGCGCAQVIQPVQDAAGLVEQASIETTTDRIRRVLERARFSLDLARQRLDREGCR